MIPTDPVALFALGTERRAAGLADAIFTADVTRGLKVHSVARRGVHGENQNRMEAPGTTRVPRAESNEEKLMTSTSKPVFRGGPNIAMKIPKGDYEATVDYYRTTLSMHVEEVEDTGSPAVARSHLVDFGPIRLWLDQVDTATRSDVWLEIHTDDLPAATSHLAEAGRAPVDEIEPLDTIGATAHWFRDPAGVVHLLRHLEHE